MTQLYLHPTPLVRQTHLPLLPVPSSVCLLILEFWHTGSTPSCHLVRIATYSHPIPTPTRIWPPVSNIRCWFPHLSGPHHRKLLTLLTRISGFRNCLLVPWHYFLVFSGLSSSLNSINNSLCSFTQLFWRVWNLFHLGFFIHTIRIKKIAALLRNDNSHERKSVQKQ